MAARVGRVTWKRSRAMAVMLMVDTNTLAPAHIGTNLHMKRPSRQSGMSTLSRLNGCVKRHSVRSEIARLMMKMLRGVRMAALRATTKQTRLLPAAPNAINSANRVIRIVWPIRYNTSTFIILLPCQVATLGKLFTHTCLYHQAVWFSTGHGEWRPSTTGKVTVGLASHWPCVTDFSGLSTYGLEA